MKRDLRMGQSGERQVVLDVRGFGFLGAQKLAPRRKVEEQRADFDTGASGSAGLAHLDEFPPVDDNLGGGWGICLALAMLGRASPRKPIVVTAARSSARWILLVAWRSRQSNASSRLMPAPSSVTRIRLRPP